MATEIFIPSFDFAAFYYPQILEALIQFKRTNVPELTDESPQEPLIQMLRAFALVGHLNNTLADQVANEAFLPTAQLPESVRNALRLIDYEMASATPAKADILLKLAQIISTPIEVIPALAKVATRSSNSESQRIFEVLDALEIEPTDELSRFFAVEDGVYTDFTANANNTAINFAPWATPVAGDATREGDSFVLMHGQMLWDTISVFIATAASGLIGVWEYWDGNYEKTSPDNVTDLGANLKFELQGYLGTAVLPGTPIRVTYKVTGVYEDLYSDYVSGVNIVTTATLLGQSLPSTDPGDYIVGSPWERLSDVVDPTADLTLSGDVTYSIPQNLTQNWISSTINGYDGFALRFRITAAGGATSPVIDKIEVHNGKQYALVEATQGQTFSEVLGSSTGLANQSFTGTKEGYISNSAVLFVDGVEWTQVSSFLESRPSDRHYVVSVIENNKPKFVFGDGITGAIPGIGANNVSVSYRYDADVDGNVGANTIEVDKTGLTYVDSLTNPRAAVGWAEAEGASAVSLAQAKINGPASLRTRDVALGPDDVENLVTRANRIDSDVIGVARAKAIEEGFGPKTVKLVIVPAGGALATVNQLANIDTFFNGDRFSSPVKKKHFVANQEVTSVNYQQKPINVTATVYRRSSITAAQIEAALSRFLQPLAIDLSTGLYIWDFGAKVSMERIIHAIVDVDPVGIYDLTMTTPVADTLLNATELPVNGTFSITVQR